MGRLISTRGLRVLAVSALAIGVLATLAPAAGPGGWDHLGDRGTPGTKSLNLVATALEVTPGATSTSAASSPTPAGSPTPIASRSGTAAAWSAVSSSTAQIANGEVFAIAVAGGKVYAGGTFTNAGTSGADNLAVWDGASWEPFCTDAQLRRSGNVRALQVIGSTLYVGGDFQDGAGIDTADYLLACDLATGTPSDTTVDPAHPFSGPVKALTATSDGTLYAGGRFGNLENIAAADNVAYLPTGGDVARHGLGRRPLQLRAGRLRPRAGHRRDRRVRRHRGIERRRHRPGRPRREVGRVGVERHGLEHRRHERVVPGGDQHLRPGQRRLERLRHRDVPERERRRARRQRRLVRRHRLAPGRLERRRQRPVGRRGLRSRDRRPAALCGRELHQRRRRHPGAVRRLVRAIAGHRLPDADGDPGSERGRRRPR